MAKIELEKCPNCGGDLKQTTTKAFKDRREFFCRNCRESLGIVKE
jgi:ssDNA-binding Zn-finger/Zn-ribbon topoisomerase 1